MKYNAITDKSDRLVLTYTIVPSHTWLPSGHDYDPTYKDNYVAVKEAFSTNMNPGGSVDSVCLT